MWESETLCTFCLLMVWFRLGIPIQLTTDMGGGGGGGGGILTSPVIGGYTWQLFEVSIPFQIKWPMSYLNFSNVH